MKPLLSIGIIFKNDIRCIERCLKALQPLRDSAPCELVMADTGSTDGSRAIAEKYADILIDFPWIDDFAAARNAVMDRCSGAWFFSVDTDEYLDPNVSELLSFLIISDERDEQIAMVNIRNYNHYTMDGDYSDFLAGRIVKMSTGVRYEGAIHEHLNFQGEVKAYALEHMILHHDGYAGFHEKDEAGQEKTQRNVRMIQKELEKKPANLLLHMQLIEAGSNSSVENFEECVRRAVKLVQEKKPGWEQLGPPILRTALYTAERLALPEWDDWVQYAEEQFPDSMFVRLDIAYAAFVHEWNSGKNQEKAVVWGERYLKALEDYKNGRGRTEQTISPLQMATPFSECEVKINIINVYCMLGRLEDAFELAKSVDHSLLTENQFSKLISALQDIHYETTLDTEIIISQLWDTISAQPQEKSARFRSALLKVASRTFFRKNREAEQAKEGFVRHAYTLYLPLQGKCEVGAAAAVMTLESASEIEAVLETVANWNAFSIHALAHGLECGVRFPLSDRPLNIEEMDSLAARLAKDKERFFPLALQAAGNLDFKDWQGLCWVRGLLIAAVRVWPWEDLKHNEEQGMEIAQAFAKIEGEFLPRCYAAEILTPDKLFVLPPLHRFGWYCAQAFAAMEKGDPVKYVHLLHAGLEACEGTKDMVEFLADHTQEMQEILMPPELRALADQVRVILARFDPADPAVAALKQSDAYQKVAYLIEAPTILTNVTAPLKIFTFWEPEGKIPAYLQLCMETWKKFIPNAEIHVLHCGNLQKYADLEGVYGPKLFTSGYSLPQISDAIRAIVLENNGSIWMDVDTIILRSDFGKYLHSQKEVSFFGYPERKTVHIAWIRAKKHAKFMQEWVAENAYKIQTLKQSDRNDQFWSWFGNSIVDPSIQKYPERAEIIDVMQEGCVPEYKSIGGNPYQAYTDFYFKKSLHIQDISASLLLLHNSWTPDEYRNASMEQLLRYDCTMTNILTELL